MGKQRINPAIVAFIKAGVIIFLITEIHSYPHSGVESSSRSSLDRVDEDRSGRRHSSSDEISQLIEKAVQDGVFLNPDQWYSINGRRPNRTVQRDTTRYMDTHDAQISLRVSSRSPLEQERFFGGTTPRSSMLSDQIVFPTDDGIIRPIPVPVCHGKTYCVQTDHYPEELVNIAIQRNDTLKYLAGVDEVSNIIQRIDATDDTPLCTSVEEVVFPQSAQDKDQNWSFIVNQENFKQGVRVETCVNENAQCSVVDVPEGYQATCKQKYVYRKLAALKGSEITEKMFMFPSSCCCHSKLDPLTRMRINVGHKGQTSVSRRRRKK